MEIKEIKKTLKLLDREEKEQMIADEKKQQKNNGDQFDEDEDEFRKFEKGMKVWKAEFN